MYLLAEISELLLFFCTAEQQLLEDGILLPFLPVILDDSSCFLLCHWFLPLRRDLLGLRRVFFAVLLLDTHFLASFETSEICQKIFRFYSLVYYLKFVIILQVY